MLPLLLKLEAMWPRYAPFENWRNFSGKQNAVLRKWTSATKNFSSNSTKLKNINKLPFNTNSFLPNCHSPLPLWYLDVTKRTASSEVYAYSLLHVRSPMKSHKVTYFHKHFSPPANISQNSENKQSTIIFLLIFL